MKIYLLVILSALCLTSCFTDQDDIIEAYPYSGDFVSKVHPTSGEALINSDETKLYLSNFKSDSGPQLELYLATDETATDFISLGALKGLEGDYTYNLDEAIDFSVYKYLIVWCVEFDVNFGQALLVKK